MNIKFVRILKIFLFIPIFFILSFIVAFFLRDDAYSYARILMHELYNQKKVDIVFCGASHVSHGIDPRLADDIFGMSVFNLGTPSQQIDGTYIMLKQAIKLYDVKKAFVELDFSMSQEVPFREPGKADFIIMNNLKDFSINLEYITRFEPKYYLNSILPIGKDKFLTLKPSDLATKTKAILTGDYFKYIYKDENSEYVSKGCVLDSDFIPNGTFSSDGSDTIPLGHLGSYWKKTIQDIIELCKENNVELVFYLMPGSDFYIHQKPNYDDYYFEVKNFLSEKNYPYYDFNLAKPELISLEDSDFSDANHLNKKGIEKWTNAACKFFKNPSEEFMYKSYEEKMNHSEAKIFGLIINPSDDNMMLIKPVKTSFSEDRISYDYFIENDGVLKLLKEKTPETTIKLPKGTRGNFIVKSYVDGMLNNTCSKAYSAY